MNDDIASLGGLDATFDLPDGRRVRLGDMTVADMRSMAALRKSQAEVDFQAAREIFTRITE